MYWWAGQQREKGSSKIVKIGDQVQYNERLAYVEECGAGNLAQGDYLEVDAVPAKVGKAAVGAHYNIQLNMIH